jgi:crotonobetainyl-CoA:carnitine CoA-transferase CaiB-like acyl-CoA transferase
MLGHEQFIALQYAPWPEQQQIFATFDALFGARTLEQWLAFFDDAEVCVGPALTLDEALAAHPERVTTLDQPGEGLLRQLGGMFGVASTRPAPALGEHSDETLVALGRSSAEIAALRAGGVI